MAKEIDSQFVHYGIRKDDLAMIEAICEKEEIEAICCPDSSASTLFSAS